MDYSVEELPQDCIDAAAVQRSFPTRNAWYRNAVCNYLRLKWISVGGNGNCLFESVIVLLRNAGILPDNLSARQLRLDLVQFFRECCDSAEALCKRILIDIEAELHEELWCSTHGKINGVRLHRFVPATRENYLNAVENDGVWAQGWHWLRAISVLYNVRVAVIIFGHPIVRYFGQGQLTIYLYKTDGDTHFDALVVNAEDGDAEQGANFDPGEGVVVAQPPPSAAGEAVVANPSSSLQLLLAGPPPSAATLLNLSVVVISSSTDEDELVHSERPILVTDTCHTEDVRFVRLSCLKHKEASVSSIVAPATAAAAAPGKCAPYTTLRCTLSP